MAIIDIKIADSVPKKIRDRIPGILEGAGIGTLAPHGERPQMLPGNAGIICGRVTATSVVKELNKAEIPFEQPVLKVRVFGRRLGDAVWPLPFVYKPSRVEDIGGTIENIVPTPRLLTEGEIVRDSLAEHSPQNSVGIAMPTEEREYYQRLHNVGRPRGAAVRSALSHVAEGLTSLIDDLPVPLRPYQLVDFEGEGSSTRISLRRVNSISPSLAKGAWSYVQAAEKGIKAGVSTARDRLIDQIIESADQPQVVDSVRRIVSFP